MHFEERPELILLGGSNGAAGSGMHRHLFQKGANMVNGQPSSSRTSHGSYSRSALKDCTVMPSAVSSLFTRWSLTSDRGSAWRQRSVSNGRPFVSAKTIRCSDFLGFSWGKLKGLLWLVTRPGPGARTFWN
jgi:hypothetical protein